ncbi:reverse transcriptase domain-containing protein [Tanacetum coccineum]|uniref:Reverse transcriptase domain-containing protein n=1 Tax=Tanacetum coccineum TaxID=301880 RepID=A0ABQ5D7R4_9ASTR
MRTRSQARRRRQPQVRQTSVESSNLEKPDNPPIVTMDDNRTMAQLLEAPTEGYEDAIVVPEITANNFEIKHVSTSSSTPAVSSDVAELKDMVRALILDKKNQTPAPASVKGINQPPTSQAPPIPRSAPAHQTPVGTFFFPADFVVVDYVADPRAPLILGRPFLRTARALIDVHGEQMTLRHDDQSVTFKVGDTKTLSYNIIETVNRVDVIDIACEEYVQEVLETSESGNPTSTSDLTA